MSNNKDVNNYCRLCASELSQLHLKNNEQLKSEHLDLLILKHLHLELDSNNILPKKACNQCCTIVSTFHNYYNQVQNAQQLLQSVFQSVVTVKVEIKTDADEPSLDNEDDKDEYPDFSYFDTEKEDVKCEIEPEVSENNSESKTEYEELNGNWKCYKCSKTFFKRFDLEKHFVDLHQSQPEYMCTDCKALFMAYSEYFEHIKEHTNGSLKLRKLKSHVCKICKKDYSNSSNLRKHMQLHLGIKPFECDVCGKKFTTKQHMLIHRNTVCTPKMENISVCEESSTNDSKDKSSKWQCLKCKLVVPTVIHLEEHFLNIHNEKKSLVKFEDGIRIYTCQVCSKEFKNSTNIHQHMRLHTGEKKFVCDACGKKFTTKQHLVAHKISHEEKPTIECQECEKKFTSPGALAYHAKVAHVEKKYECKICCKKFVGELRLEKHYEWHKRQPNEMPKSICEQCGKEFLDAYRLKSHLKSHLVERPFQCDQCPKNFTYSRLLQLHKTTHSGTKNFKCEECGKGFSLLGRLTSHKKTHTTELQYECEHCKKRFKRSYYLKVHLRQHTGEKPYACLECNHFFALDSNFIKHLKGRHGLKKFSIVNQHQYPFSKTSNSE